jgi:hypothetical protein
MTNTERANRIEQIKKQRFFLHMKDRWDAKDYATDARLAAEQHTLERELKEEE